MSVETPPAPAAAPANAAPGTAASVTNEPKAAPAAAAVVTEPKKDAAAEPGAPKTEPAKVQPEVKKEDLKLPDGSLLDPKNVDEILALSKEKGWTKETAQAILERESKLLSSHAEGEKAKLTQIQNSWTEAARTDVEIGGERFAENLECANRVFKTFGNDGVKSILDSTKAGNHPDIIRMFNRIGRAFGIMDDKFVVPNGQASGQPKDAAEVLFGKTSAQENK